MENQERSKNTAVAVAEILEVIVACKLASEDTFDLSDLDLCKSMAYLPKSAVPSILLQIICCALTCSDITKGITLSSLLTIVVAEDSCYIVRLDPLALIVDENDSVCVSIVDYAYVALVFDYFFLQIPAVLLFKRVWLMIREGAIEVIIDVVDVLVVCKNIFNYKV